MIVIQPTGAEPSFGYRSVLKDLYLKGKLPLENGFYGAPLTKDTVSLEHLLPVSKGGKTSLDNLVLCTKENNIQRGNQPLSGFLNKEAMDSYLKSLESVKLKDFNGKKYVKDIKETVARILRNENHV